MTRGSTGAGESVLLLIIFACLLAYLCGPDGGLVNGGDNGIGKQRRLGKNIFGEPLFLDTEQRERKRERNTREDLMDCEIYT
ncbi:hypothetical protein F4811DRAFT_218221 [Daldinia bambusicola]|nr:hypothetical protein F4811DRAFT_218221 [Daldinia bambusicola]